MQPASPRHHAIRKGEAVGEDRALVHATIAIGVFEQRDTALWRIGGDLDSRDSPRRKVVRAHRRPSHMATQRAVPQRPARCVANRRRVEKTAAPQRLKAARRVLAATANKSGSATSAFTTDRAISLNGLNPPCTPQAAGHRPVARDRRRRAPRLSRLRRRCAPFATSIDRRLCGTSRRSCGTRGSACRRSSRRPDWCAMTGRMRSATQLLRSSLASKAMSLSLPSATMFFVATDLSIDDDFDRDFARLTDARALEMPVRLLRSRRSANRAVGFFTEPRGDARRDASRSQVRRASIRCPASPIAHVVHFEIDQVARAVADVVAARADAFAPVVVSRACRQLHVAAAEADALAVDARKIRLAADARAEAGVERVIPDVQFPRRTACPRSR